MKSYNEFKFAIKQILESKPGNKIPALKLELTGKLKISRDWLNKILNARLNSPIKLDHKQLAIIADVLKVKVDSLYTKQCREAIRKSIVQLSSEQAA